MRRTTSRGCASFQIPCNWNTVFQDNVLPRFYTFFVSDARISWKIRRRRCRDYIGEILNAPESVHSNYRILVASIYALPKCSDLVDRLCHLVVYVVCVSSISVIPRSPITVHIRSLPEDLQTWAPLWSLEIPSDDKIAIGWWLIAFFVRAKIFGVCGDGGGRLARATCNSIGYFDDPGTAERGGPESRQGFNPRENCYEHGACSLIAPRESRLIFLVGYRGQMLGRRLCLASSFNPFSKYETRHRP